MHTDNLIRMLATGLEPVPPGVAQRRWSIALALSVPVAVLLMLLTLGLVPALGTVAAQPMFWVKLGLPLALLGASLRAAGRLARPGATLGYAPLLIATPLVLIWALAAFTLHSTPSAARPTLLFGSTWTLCPLLIAWLSLPTFVAALWALRGLAPTRLRLAGASAGLLAGAVGALVYTLHCQELAAPFIALWYVLGIWLPAGVGACLGPLLLRW